MTTHHPGNLIIEDVHNCTLPAQELIGTMLTLRHCTKVRLVGWIIRGGANNVELEHCTDCDVTDCTLIGPTGPADPQGHNVLVKDSLRCKVTKNRLQRGRDSEMGGGVFGGVNCQFNNNIVTGILDERGNVIDQACKPSADAFTADYRSKACKFINNRIDLTGPDGRPCGYGAVNLAWGRGHVVDQRRGSCIGSKLEQPYAANPCYLANGKPADADKNPKVVPVRDCSFWGIPPKMLFIHAICEGIRINGHPR